MSPGFHSVWTREASLLAQELPPGLVKVQVLIGQIRVGPETLHH